MKKFFSTKFTNDQKNDHHVEVAVLACIDPRFRQPDQQAIEEGLGLKHFDLFRWPGVTKPILTSEEFFQLFCQAIKNVSVKLHHAKKILLLCHWDCGGYGGSCAFVDEKEEEQRYSNDLAEAKQKLAAEFPDLEIIIGYSKLEGEELNYYLI